MIVYLDESYDQPKKRFLLLGLLFSPSKKLHRMLALIHRKKQCLDKHNNIIETKYNNCFTNHNFDVCKEFIDAYLNSDSWFSAIVVDTKKTDFNLSYFGQPHEPESIKKARVYKRFTELLILKNTKSIKNAVLLVDEVTRCNHDRFIELIRESFCIPGEGYNINRKLPIFRHIGSIKSDSPENVRLCACDLLLGCILNNNLPTENKWKNMLRKYLVKKIGVNSLLEDDWAKGKVSSKISRKLRVWYWKPEKKKAQVLNHRK